MLPHLTPDELHRYEWQLWVRDFGEEGQRKLKAASVLVSRIGGVGGTVAMQLAAAGVGRLVLAHAGNLRLDDLNRQLLMSTEGIGRPRIEAAEVRLRALNPHVEIETVAENISEANAAELVGRVDLVVGAAPLFTERLLLNREAVRQGKPLVDSSMYDLEGRVTTGNFPCSARWPRPSARSRPWKRSSSSPDSDSRWPVGCYRLTSASCRSALSLSPADPTVRCVAPRTHPTPEFPRPKD
ncbi:MAG: HesA/MoeB/ThiF family protein [Pirellulaceae bacterium]|nr:HesA/MoeB/ThiF family protein [Pirellulaceae bacterium]